MSKTISQFRFKQFALWHHRSAMKVGVDGVLVGAWTDVDGARSILDVGTGCGLIALMMAQRQPDARITGIEMDLPSVEEARENVASSPWHDRIEIVHGSFPSALDNPKFDLIVSNPPFFDSGISSPDTPREKARHQAELSPASLIAGSGSLLNPGGSLAMIIPADMSVSIENQAMASGYTMLRKCPVRGNHEKPVKRVLLQWRISSPEDILKNTEFRDTGLRHVDIQNSILTLESSPGIPTDDYKSLCREFYLKF
ncbi:MAG: methyltransferase [Muribaculaceae bacterium]|nr:methyltransferase [Muribaculaceae bacterium]